MNERGQGGVLVAVIVLGAGGIMRIFDAIWAFRYDGVVPALAAYRAAGSTFQPEHR